MRRRRTLILTGFMLALVAMLPVTALAGAWAVVCTTGDGTSHLELAHQPTGCDHNAQQHPRCAGSDHDHPPVPCEDQSLGLNDFRVPDRSAALACIDLPLPVLLYEATAPMTVTLATTCIEPLSAVRAGPPPGVTTTILRL